MISAPRTLTSFQTAIRLWMLETFGMEIARDVRERNHRFIEEALELVQAGGCTAHEAHLLVEYVFGRPIGELGQEIGGVMVTLAALCDAHGADLGFCAERERERIWTKIQEIRAKQAGKPKHSPLPSPARRKWCPQHEHPTKGCEACYTTFVKEFERS